MKKNRKKMKKRQGLPSCWRGEIAAPDAPAAASAALASSVPQGEENEEEQEQKEQQEQHDPLGVLAPLQDQAPRPSARTRQSTAIAKRPHSPDPLPDPLPQCKRARMPIGSNACGLSRASRPGPKAHGIPVQPPTQPGGKNPCIPRKPAPWPIGKARLAKPPAPVKAMVPTPTVRAMVPTPPKYPPPIGRRRMAKPPARERSSPAVGGEVRASA